MLIKKIDKNYQSSIDQKLREFNQTHPKSKSQLAEMAKNARVARLRDNADSSEATPAEPALWDGF